MDYSRFGSAGIDAPGGMTLIGLMGMLTTADGAAPDALVLVHGQMDPESCSAPTVHPRGFIVHILTGAAMAIVADEAVRLLAGNTVLVASTQHTGTARYPDQGVHTATSNVLESASIVVPASTKVALGLAPYGLTPPRQASFTSDPSQYPGLLV